MDTNSYSQAFRVWFFSGFLPDVVSPSEHTGNYGIMGYKVGKNIHACFYISSLASMSVC